jgi:hypothetical protein
MHDYLGRLHEDINLSLVGTENTRKFVAANLENLMVVARAIRECAIADEDKDRFANGLFHLGKVIPAQFVDGTLSELRASGRLLLLRNAELRKAINQTVYTHDYLSQIFPSVQRRANNDRDYIDSKTIYNLDRPITGFTLIEWSEIDLELEKVCEDREFSARLSGLQRVLNVNLDWLDREIANFKTVLALLEKELEPPQ